MIDPSTPTNLRIHQAALRLFSRRGYAATGIRDLATEAGLSSSSLYNHIGSKEDLLLRIMRDGYSRLWTSTQAGLVGVDDPVVRLGRLVQVHVYVHATYRQECRVIDAEFGELVGAAREEILAQRDTYEALWAEVLEAGTHRGAMVVPDLRVARLGLLTMCTGVAHWFRPEGPNDVYEVSLGHVDLVLAATTATRGRRRVSASALPLLEREWFDRALPDQPAFRATA